MENKKNQKNRSVFDKTDQFLIFFFQISKIKIWFDFIGFR
jgi:hypothetical protein